MPKSTKAQEKYFELKKGRRVKRKKFKNGK